jgi:FkbM family methyltransferase
MDSDMSAIDRDMQDSPKWWALLGELEGDLLFDIGANVGQAAWHMGPHFGSVVSLEPCKESFLILAAECDLNVHPVNKAASNVDGFIMLNESSNSIRDGSLTTGSGRLTWGPNVGMRGVPAVTLNTLVRDYGMPEVVKIDVEGHELQVLEGASDLFGHSNFYIEMHAAEYEVRARDLLAGYNITRYENRLPCVKGSPDSYYLAANGMEWG